MKRWLVSFFIVGYVGALTFGVGCHTLNSFTTSHPLMYFIVWDMFCGWTSYATQAHVVGEGESGRYYELSPGPWGDVKAWGTLDRQNFDVFMNHTHHIALNTLRHTQHEPITRILVLEEHWAKKYDLPEHVWRMRYDEPKPAQIPKYPYVRAEFGPNGEWIRNHISWISYQFTRIMSDNPRLMVDKRRAKSTFVLNSAEAAIAAGIRMTGDPPLDEDQAAARTPSAN